MNKLDLNDQLKESHSPTKQEASEVLVKARQKTLQWGVGFNLDESAGQIHWYCNRCRGEGVVYGWQGLIWGMTNSDGLVQ